MKKTVGAAAGDEPTSVRAPEFIAIGFHWKRSPALTTECFDSIDAAKGRDLLKRRLTYPGCSWINDHFGITQVDADHSLASIAMQSGACGNASAG